MGNGKSLRQTLRHKVQLIEADCGEHIADIVRAALSYVDASEGHLVCPREDVEARGMWAGKIFDAKKAMVGGIESIEPSEAQQGLLPIPDEYSEA